MVCTKLKRGVCNITKSSCRKSYLAKMIKFKSCPVFKKGKVKKVSKVRKKVKKKIKKKR